MHSPSSFHPGTENCVGTAYIFMGMYFQYTKYILYIRFSMRPFRFRSVYTCTYTDIPAFSTQCGLKPLLTFLLAHSKGISLLNIILLLGDLDIVYLILGHQITSLHYIVRQFSAFKKSYLTTAELRNA